MLNYKLCAAIIGFGLLTTPAVAGPFDGVFDTQSGLNLTATGSVFNQNLYMGYKDLSKRLDGYGNSRDAELFNHKAVLAGHESPVDPDFSMDRNLDSSEKNTFENAHYRLRQAFNRGAKEFAPVSIAKAQVSYDCWIEATEDHVLSRADMCKQDFETAMNEAEKVSNNDIVMITISSPLQPLNIETPQPVQTQLPVEVEEIPQAILDQYFIVPFEFDSSAMTTDGLANLEGAINALSHYGTLRVNLTAHADRSGAELYNQRLSQRRADEVLTRLTQAGITADRIDVVQAVGETKPLVPTADGVKEPDNRVVELDLKK